MVVNKNGIKLPNLRKTLNFEEKISLILILNFLSFTYGRESPVKKLNFSLSFNSFGGVKKTCFNVVHCV